MLHTRNWDPQYCEEIITDLFYPVNICYVNLGFVFSASKSFFFFFLLSFKEEIKFGVET